MEIILACMTLTSYVSLLYVLIVEKFNGLGKFQAWMNDGSYTLVVFMGAGIGLFLWMMLCGLILKIGEDLVNKIDNKSSTVH